MDAQTVLEDYVQSIDNLPSEIQFILDEMLQRDNEFHETREKIRQNDLELKKYILENQKPNENMANDIKTAKIDKGDKTSGILEAVHKQYEKAKYILEEKIKMASKSVELMDKHIKRLNVEIEKIDIPEAVAALTRANSIQNMPSHTLSRNYSMEVMADLDEYVPEKVTSLFTDYTYTVGKRIPSHNTSDTKIQISLKRLKRRDFGDVSTDGDDNVYCYCRQSSYGEMIACDNGDCPYEWFHLGCVGLSEPPTGAWFCDHCLEDK